MEQRFLAGKRIVRLWPLGRLVHGEYAIDAPLADVLADVFNLLDLVRCPQSSVLRSGLVLRNEVDSHRILIEV